MGLLRLFLTQTRTSAFWQLSSSSTSSLNQHKTFQNPASETGAESKTLQLNSPFVSKDDPRTHIRRTLFVTYFALVIPITTFALGCWQWKRHKWKTELIGKIKSASKIAPVEFPADNLPAIDNMEFRKVRIKGVYLFDRQFVIRWRKRVDPANDNSSDPATNYGAYVITPMRLDGTNVKIMVNRGWISTEKIESELEKGKQRGQSELKTLNATVRRAEKGSLFARNNPEKGIWAFKDLNQMSQHCGTTPIIVDADFESTEKDEPIGGQTNVTLRNQHYSYMIQWLGLTVATLGMWSLQFL